MEDVKSWISSKTIWVNIITMIVGIATSAGWVSEAAGVAVVSSVPDLIVGGVVLVLGALSAWTRFKATAVLK